MWHGPYIVMYIFQNEAYELIDYEGYPLDQLKMGCISKNTMHEFLMHVLVYISVCLIFLRFWLGVLCEKFFLLIV